MPFCNVCLEVRNKDMLYAYALVIALYLSCPAILYGE